MFENGSLVLIESNKSEKNISQSQKANFPAINAKHFAKGSMENYNFEQKQKFKLPRIKEKIEISGVPRMTSQPPKLLISPSNKSKKGTSDYKNTFARQVEDKMRNVLGGLNPNNVNNLEITNCDLDDFDFQTKVNANKEIIKKHRQNIKHPKNPSGVIERKPPVPPQSAKKSGARNQTVFEKKQKKFEYHLEKSRSKRKQSTKFSSNPLARKGSQKNLKSLQKSKSKSKVLPLKYQTENHNLLIIKQESKKNNLFDGIQNYLAKPTSMKKLEQKNMDNTSLHQAKKDLENKIKQINQRLGIEDKQQNASPSTTHNSDEGLRNGVSEKQWKKVQISNKVMSIEETTFEKQIERLGELQQKNEITLQQYLEQQKILMELDLQKKKL